MTPPEVALVPPISSFFSITKTSVEPDMLAVKAAVRPPQPVPTTKTSTCLSNSFNF